uniref:Uncharacterized protein n=1 Tax=uncultured prokaryote TaxID=198431 RepID=A0A0H5Q543_9ZZZZ|nr:hypothetical protein [uncultured prokaryote]
MEKNERWADLLERQASVIDGLDLYLEACGRRGITDVVAVSSRDQAVRVYRKSLASMPVEALFLYACRDSRSRQS